MVNSLGLSDEQVEKAAAEAMMEMCHIPRTGGINTTTVLRDAINASDWCNAVRAAAPFLQAPLAEPTEEEVAHITKDIGWGSGRMGEVRRILALHTHRRNAPPTVDRRREAICNVLLADLKTLDGRLVNKLLAALDEVK